MIWVVPEAVLRSSHGFKYRLALIVNDVCVVRYDNEAGEADHIDRTDDGKIAFSYDEIHVDFVVRAA